MAFLVKVQHQSVQRTDCIGNGAMIILELSAMRCPHRQTMLQLLVATFYPCAHLLQPRLTAQSLPILSGCRLAGGAMTPAYTSEKLLLLSLHLILSGLIYLIQ